MYVFHHSDNQNITHSYLAVVQSSGSQLPKPLGIYFSVDSTEGAFCFVNEVTFGKPLRMGLVVSGANL